MIVWPRLLVGVDVRNDGSSYASFCSATPSFSTSALVFGSIGDRDDRLGEDHLLEDDRLVLVAERVAGARVAKADRRVDVAGVALGELFALVGVHAQDAADALALAARRVHDHRAALERPE